MNTNTRLLGILSGALILASCSRIDECTYDEAIIDYSFRQALSEYRQDPNNRVSVHDVDYFIQTRLNGALMKGSRLEHYSITPIISSDEDTLMYIVNYQDGWEIISADKRIPAILGTSEHGMLSLESEAPDAIWLDNLAQDMLMIRSSADEELAFCDEGIESNSSSWLTSFALRDSVDEDTHGYYKLYSTTFNDTYYDSVEHLMLTQWHQSSPYNEYCPTKTSGSGRSPAGCVAVAGAQMLYYLHSVYAAPTSFYSEASCIGDVNSYTQSFSNPTSSVWGLMGTAYDYDPYHKAAIVIADAGLRVHMEYGDSSSGSSFSSLVDDYFPVYGYSCDLVDFDVSVVRSSLLSNMPVIAAAYPSGTLGYLRLEPGHAFIIDGYRRVARQTIKHYRWLDDLTGNYDDSVFPDYYVTETDAPQITQIKMNWGWWTQWSTEDDSSGGHHNYDNSGWYTLTGDWSTTEGNYSNHRKIISGFELIQ